jgi:hypothetical protein
LRGWLNPEGLSPTSYAYNNAGAAYLPPISEYTGPAGLGLGGPVPSLNYPVYESQVVCPSDMIAIGDAPIIPDFVRNQNSVPNAPVVFQPIYSEDGLSAFPDPVYYNAIMYGFACRRARSSSDEAAAWRTLEYGILRWACRNLDAG